jgi:trehalose 6-phosphate phosphatase
MTEAEDGTFSIRGIPDFWTRVRRARRKFLALDYDGTLAPFRVDRMKAFPLEGIPECLSLISGSGDTTLVIISGRVVDEVAQLLGGVEVMIVGSHGWETRAADGTYRPGAPSPQQQRMLDRAVRQVSERGLDGQAERKVASLAVHTRGLPKERAAEIQNSLCRLWEPIANEEDMECLRFAGGVELRSKGVDKGTILRELLEEHPEDTLAVYVGDDETDEDAFRAIRPGGSGIRVGPEGVPTLAQGRLADCQAVLEFLREWIRVTNTG